jgi:hypothetical protein
MIIRVCTNKNITYLNNDIQSEVNRAYDSGHFLQDVTMKVTSRGNEPPIHSVLLVFGDIPTS